MNSIQYRYKATVVRWVDGDTVDLFVDLGFHHFVKTRFRLYGINTPERGKDLWGEATDFAESQAPVGSEVLIDVYKVADKYGRWLATVYVDGHSVNEALVASALAVPYMGGKK